MVQYGQCGNNKKGQLGNGEATSKSKLSQISRLENITKIAAGQDFGIAVDSHGIVYEWGRDVLEPKVVDRVTGRVIDIAAGNDQSVFVTAKGTVIGYGSILTGELKGIDNAVKTQIIKDKIIILTTDYKVYEYTNGALEEIQMPEQVIDISGNNTSVMLQTEDEKVYVYGENINGQLGLGHTNSVQNPVQIEKTNIYGIGVGQNNTYIIENSGNVYAAGYNKYGSIGNGTRVDTNEYTLVGNRNFKIDPITKIMKVGDIEEITIKGEPFNVFGENKVAKTEYTWIGDNETAIKTEEGKLTACRRGNSQYNSN